jgi:hypothetical protein
MNLHFSLSEPAQPRIESASSERRVELVPARDQGTMFVQASGSLVIRRSEAAVSNLFASSTAQITVYFVKRAPPRDRREEVRSWQQHLAKLQASHGSLSSEQVASLSLFWQRLASWAPPPTQAGSVPGGVFQLVWDSGSHHIEVDIRADGLLEWFYRNRQTRAFEGEGDEQAFPASRIPERLLTHLQKL